MKFFNKLYIYISMSFFQVLYFKLKRNRIKVSNLTNKIQIKDNQKKLNYKRVRIIVAGKNNLVILHSDLKLRNIEINIRGNNNVLEINENSFIQNSKIIVHGDENKIILGKNNDIYGVKIWCFENNGKIQIGEDCLFSYDIEIRNTDSHPIYDMVTKKRLNFSRDVIIDDKVWLGAGVKVLKGVYIGKGNIVGQQSIITKSIMERNSIIVGNNKIIKNNVRWEKEFEK